MFQRVSGEFQGVVGGFRGRFRGVPGDFRDALSASGVFQGFQEVSEVF